MPLASTTCFGPAPVLNISSSTSLAWVELMVRASTRSASSERPPGVTLLSPISVLDWFNSLASSLLMRLARALARLPRASPSREREARASSKKSAVGLAAVSSEASYSDRLYWLSKRSWRASGISGSLARTSSTHCREMSSGGRSGSGR